MADKQPPVTSSFDEDSSFQNRQQKAQAELRESEKKASEQARRTEEANQTRKPDETPEPLATDYKKKKKGKKRWAISSSAGLTVILIMSLAIVATVLLSPSLLLLNVKEKLTNDLNDALGYYYTTTEKVMAYQLSNGSGCASHGDDSIQCKFSTMSENLRDRYLGYGFEVTESGAVDVDEDELNYGRIKVSRVKFPGGGTAGASNLYSVANQSELNRQRLDRVFNPSKGIFHSRGYIERLYSRFHIQQSRLPIGLTNEEVVDIFNQNLLKQADYMDKDGRGVFGLHYLAETEDEYWYEEVYDHILDKAETHLALGCSMHTYADIGENALRQAKATTLARFAMQYLTLADSIKAGRTMQMEQVVGTLANNLTHVDSLSGESAYTSSDMSSYRSPTFHEDPDVGGPRMINGTDFMLDFSNMLMAVQGRGRDTSTYLRSIMSVPATDATVDHVNSSRARDLCVHGTTGAQADYEMQSPDRCWLEETLPTAAAFGPRTTAAVMAVYTPLKMIWSPSEPPCLGISRHVDLIKEGASSRNEPVRSAAGSYVDRIRDAASEESEIYHLAEDIADGIHSTQTMDAIFAGTGVILGDTAQWLGMQPADTDSLREYLEETVEIRTMLARQEVYEAKDTPFDLANPHSFISSVVLGAYKDGKYNSIASLAGKALSVVPNALASSISRGVSATAGRDVEYLTNRLIDDAGSCGIENIQDSINPDFSCAVRYSVNQDTINLSVEDVLDFMTREDAADDSATSNSEEVQGRDTEQMGSHGDRMKTTDSEAQGVSFIDRATGAPTPNSEYWKFLEYCSNRPTSWGSVGMEVAHADEVYEPDEKDQTDKRTYGPPFYMDMETEVDNSRESYYGYAWGGTEDYGWLTGERCQEDSEMINNFRAYTAMCAVHAATSGARKCWHHDSIALHRDDFTATNGILYVSE